MGRHRFLRALAGVATLAVAGAALADGPAPRVTTEVRRAEVRDTDHPTLRFLRDNRDFIRGQLDRLRLLTVRRSEGDARDLDTDLLRLRELAAAIAAAGDTVDAATLALARRDLLDSVTRLGGLEADLDRMDLLVADQRARLRELEADFLGRQETALVVVVRGLPAGAAPDGIVLGEDNDFHDVALDGTTRAALRRGGVAQVWHRYVEPRDHVYSLAFTGGAWDSLPAVDVPLAAGRDRITFLELDLTALDPERPDLGLAARTWER